MLSVLKRTVSMRRFFEHPKHLLKLMDKKIITFALKILLNWPYELNYIGLDNQNVLGQSTMAQLVEY